jgi:serine/threonine-protein kinase
LVGRTLAGRYLVEGVLGRGTMGVVYSCRHLILERSVAIKILKPDMAQDEEVLQRFMTEAKAASSIGSEHIVDVLDFGRLADGSSYLVMEQLSGQTLGELLSASPLLPANIVLSIASQVAAGLAAAHAAGVVHRDLKPDNIFLTETAPDEYFVKILDFGIAKVQASQNKLTQQGTLVGTPHYMSPEQATAGPADQRADIYSLGVILFELATGDVPFDGETPVAVLTQHVHDKPPGLETRLPEGRFLPQGLGGVIRKCLAKNVERRYQNVEELLEDLFAIISGSDPDISIELEQDGDRATTSFTHPAGRSARSLFYVALVVAVLLGVAWGTREYLRDSNQPPTIVTVAAPAPLLPPSVPTTDEKPQGIKVDLILFPLDAHVFHGDKDLGQMPVSVHVKEGEKLRLLVKRNGYWPRRLVIDGKRSRVVVGLRKYSQPQAPDEETDLGQAANNEPEEDEDSEAAATDRAEREPKSGSAAPKSQPQTAAIDESDSLAPAHSAKPAPTAAAFPTSPAP